MSATISDGICSIKLTQNCGCAAFCRGLFKAGMIVMSQCKPLTGSPNFLCACEGGGGKGGKAGARATLEAQGSGHGRWMMCLLRKKCLEQKDKLILVILVLVFP